jgi:hypothetical protein
LQQVGLNWGVGESFATSANLAIFNFSAMHGYDVQSPSSQGRGLPRRRGRPNSKCFHVTWTRNPGGRNVNAHYHFDERDNNGLVACEEQSNRPQTDPGWAFIKDAHPYILRNTSLSIATELANEIDAKFALQCTAATAGNFQKNCV